jgi:hypothetical protein
MHLYLFQAYSGQISKQCWQLAVRNSTEYATKSDAVIFEDAVYDVADDMGLASIYNHQFSPFPKSDVEYHAGDEGTILEHAMSVAERLGVELEIVNS